MILGPRYLLGEKIISSVLSKSTVNPFVCSHSSTSSNLALAFMVALCGVAETDRMAPSSTYRDREECFHEALRVSRYDVKMALRMGERGDPWGVLSGTEKGLVFEDSNLMDAFQLVRNEKTHSTIFGGNPFFANMSLARFASIWSKKPDMSKRMREAWYPDDLVAWILWIRAEAASVVQCWGLDPNWLFGKISG